MPGLYYGAADPLDPTMSLTHTLTDSNGTVAFNDIMFTRSGSSGKYIIQFVCDGIQSNQKLTVNVRSSVASIQIIKQLPPSFYNGVDDISNI
jgi:hypothetical protein